MDDGKNLYDYRSVQEEMGNMCKIDMKLIKERGITRLCHFTKSKNLPHILGEFGGIKSSDKIPNHYKDVNDLLRLLLENLLDIILVYLNIF